MQHLSGLCTAGDPEPIITGRSLQQRALLVLDGGPARLVTSVYSLLMGGFLNMSVCMKPLGPLLPGAFIS